MSTLTNEMINHNYNIPNSQNIINNYPQPDPSLFTTQQPVPGVTIPGNLNMQDVIFVINMITTMTNMSALTNAFNSVMGLWTAIQDLLDSLNGPDNYTYIETYIMVYHQSNRYIQTAIGSRVVTKEKNRNRPELTVSSTVSVIPYTLLFIEENCYQNSSTKNYITHLVLANSQTGVANIYDIASLGEIRDYAFRDCVNFEGFSDDLGLTIPNSMYKIGIETFKNCSKLKSINFLNENNLSIGNNAFENCSRLTSLIIPSTVTSIGDSAFKGCTNLTSLIIFSGVNSVGNNAFQGCTNLKEIRINCDSNNIGENAFLGLSLTYEDIIALINNSSGKISKAKLIYWGFNKLAVNMALGSFDLIVNDSNVLINCDSTWMNISDV